MAILGLELIQVNKRIPNDLMQGKAIECPAVQCKDVVSGSIHFNPFFLKT